MDTRDAVRRFVVRARDLAGSGEELGRRMEPFYGELPAAPTVNAWAAGRNEPLGRALFAMALAIEGLSLDEYAHGEEEQRRLAVRLDRQEQDLADLRQEVEYLKAERDEVRQRLGMPPYPVREPRREAAGEVS